MRLNRTSEWKVMTIWVSREIPLFNFSVLIYYALESDIRVKSYDHLNFTRDSVVQFQGSGYIMRLNRTSEWKVMTIWICRELPFFNFERLDILYAWIGHLSEKLWPFEFPESFCCSILSVSIYYAFQSDLWVKSDDHLIFQELPYSNFERLDILCALIRPPS